ncbi:hypothetical protein H6F44_18795 [Pseudanabaena sp. FACHB-1277]|uniref:Uncharacterized protein n=1 Tax=Pseudanabaena cinerea FACHB-1277 TaxID=2949581 RepID=A0A926Z7J6_9CYAN|nr:hypothetical protein [Pseudanabaena cinerea]MBD2152151.1 hypothetical protein [Pseudanabaena cinerea FACHB-1277]
MTQNPLVEQAKEGNISAIASLMNRLLKSQGMLANVERIGDRLDVLIESDLRSLDDEMRVPKRQVLVGMLKKWFITLDVQNVSTIVISWQQAGSVEPAWTEEVALVETENRLNQEPSEISQNSGVIPTTEPRKLPPLPVFPPKPMLERNSPTGDRPLSLDAQLPIAPKASPDLDEMFGDTDGFDVSDNTAIAIEPLVQPPMPSPNLDPFPTLNDETNALLSDMSVETELTAPDSAANLPSDRQFSWQSLLSTPSVSFQFLQYLVVCAIIVVGLRGIHAALGGGTKAAKPAAIAPELVQDHKI